MKKFSILEIQNLLKDKNLESRILSSINNISNNNSLTINQLKHLKSIRNEINLSKFINN